MPSSTPAAVVAPMPDAALKHTDDGALGVVFEDGTVLSVPSDALAEAWEFAGPDRSGVVSLAGGGLSTWVDVVPPKSRGRP